MTSPAETRAVLPTPPSPAAAPVLDAVVVGGGLAGMYLTIRLAQAGRSFRSFEAGSDLGGTWWFNRYPGARCDVESIDYSYAFDPELEQEWTWTERYATQPEILRYLHHVAARYDIRPHYTFDTRVTGATYGESAGLWTVTTSGAETLQCRYLYLATGPLSAVNRPGFPGLDGFRGRIFHTARWPMEGVDFTGRRVAVIGTGSSGIQCVPEIATRASELWVLQRTANYSIPADNRPYTDDEISEYKRRYPERRQAAYRSGGGSPFVTHPRKTFEVDDDTRRAVYEQQWQMGGVLFSKAFPDQLVDEEANAAARRYFDDKLRDLVDDPQVADDLTPSGYAIGTKRICTDSGYFTTFNQPHVHLVNLRRSPLESIEATGIRTGDDLIEVDDLVLATGFDSLTGSVLLVPITGRGGRSLAEAWDAGPRTYLGFMTAGFPNLFIINGPGSPSVLANLFLTSEHQIDWLDGLVRHAESTHPHPVIEADPDAQEAWVERSDEMAAHTLFTATDSWYMGANVPGKPRMFMPYIGGFASYRDICDEVAADDHGGFRISSTAAPVDSPRPDSAPVTAAGR